MTDTSPNAVELKLLDPEANRGYLPQAIPTTRDEEIIALLSRVVAESRIARFARQVGDGHARVLRVFAERMATAAIRNSDAALLRLAMISLLLSWRSDRRETLVVFPVLYDAIRRMGLDIESFAASIRETVGDQLISPFVEFLQRSDHNKSLEVMGYRVGTDNDGFRYVRNW